MYKFPEGVYTEVRREHVFSTNILLEDGGLTENRTKTDEGVIIRVFDGKRWYASAITAMDQVQNEIDSLAAMAEADDQINQHPVVKAFEVNCDEVYRYRECCVENIGNREKLALALSYNPVVKESGKLEHYRIYYQDSYTVKQIVTSKGTNVTFDMQNACICVRGHCVVNGLPTAVVKDLYDMRFEPLAGRQAEILMDIEKTYDYANNAVPVEPGIYTCILSPETAGIFAHESFGHKSEADFMVGDETMRREWALGSRVGAGLLNIFDDGGIEGSGYVPFDDEGTMTKKTWLIKDGILSGRLHSAETAAALSEEVTGNARAVNFTFEPMVRMTCTCIGAGSCTKEELFAGVEDGIYIDSIRHGSGMSTFTIAPRLAYRIRRGKIAEPVKISVISGNVMKTLYEIDGVSDTMELQSFALGGCGKMEQYPLRVGFGGPYVRVNNITVQ